MADAYFMDLDMMLKMFYTLNAWGYWAHFVRGGPIGIYNKWLDRHLRWYSEPPYGFNNAFQLFHIKIGLCDKIKLLLLTPLGFFPFIGVVITYKQFKYTCKSMILGGSQATLDDEYTISNLFGPWFMEVSDEGNLKKIQIRCTNPPPPLFPRSVVAVAAVAEG